jgi:hypothetical protein
LFHLPLRNWLGNADQLSIENSHGRDRSSRHEGEENHQAGIRIASAMAAGALGNWSLVVEPLGVSLDKTDDEPLRLGKSRTGWRSGTTGTDL